jgi:nitroimidazol reductase NimA-like FMN-containing flavoprotein (pyridoxamine 5'-phosphate oxidase superfamily)
MTAAEFVAFWQGERMATVSTVSAAGAVHAVPMIPELVDGKFYLPTFPDSIRRRDHAANSRCAITSWEDAYRAVIVYGTAREVPSIPAGDEERRHQPGSLVTIEVTPTRMFAIRPPRGHPRYREP